MSATDDFEQTVRTIQATFQENERLLRENQELCRQVNLKAEAYLNELIETLKKFRDGSA